MILSINYLPDELAGRITVSGDFPTYAWNDVKSLFIGVQPNVSVSGNNIIAEWASVLLAARGLASLRIQHGFIIEYDTTARTLLQNYQSEFKAIRAAEGTQTIAIPENEIQQRLTAIGFKRILTPQQIRDTAKLVALPHGANFSVPGAGKTTVALAVHLLTKSIDTCLLVVAPKNAFAAWDEVLVDCIDSKNAQADAAPFTRLTGGNTNIQYLLGGESKRLIISYDQLIRSPDNIRQFLSLKKVHSILDESHRMKAGEQSQRGLTLLSLAHLPVRRDILSGTPIPRTLNDIVSQVNFLWPGQNIGKGVIESSSPKKILKGLYVRTTKAELGLRSPRREFKAIEMSSPQLALYGLMRAEVLKHLAGIKSGGTVDLARARKSVIRLLQVSSNPILAVRAMTDFDPDTYAYDDPKVESIFSAIIAELDSPKILGAVSLARELAAKGQKSIIWTTFTYNVERIAELLADQGATYIHGQVDAGELSDPNSREGRIHRFHEDNGCFVLVANPAACSEGISLHRVCHNAIYVDRTYNAGHYLQSVDRIHRLGLDPMTETYIYLLESVAPNITGAIDYSVRRRLIDKVRTMADVLDDTDLHQLAMDEEEGDEPINFDITLEDMKDVIDELTGLAHAPTEGEEM